MAQKNSVLIKSSRYVSGGTTEVNANALEWWERVDIPTYLDDQAYVVEKKFAGRLDLITALYLGEPRYWWVVAMYNNILDPNAECTEGSIIYIPPLERVKALLNGKTGGVASLRQVPISILPIV